MAANIGLDNDARGWILCFISGIACVFGASVVYLDVFVRMLPGKSNFRIQESNAFLACSLSLSFGVMMFSSLYGMLPEAKEYLKRENWNDRKAGLLLMSCFIAGFLGIQAVSRILHQHMPSHVVDCDHSHKDTPPFGDGSAHNPHHRHNNLHYDDSCNSVSSHSHHRPSRRSSPYEQTKIQSHAPVVANGACTLNMAAVETTPLLGVHKQRHGGGSASSTFYRGRARTAADAEAIRRPSILAVQKRVMSFVKDTKSYCGEEGSCYGYSDPCGQECFKHISQRAVRASRSLTRLRTTMGSFYPPPQFPTSLDTHSDSNAVESPVSPMYRTSRATSRDAVLLRPPFESVHKDDETPQIDCQDYHNNVVDDPCHVSDIVDGRDNIDDDDCRGSCAASHAEDLEAQQQQHHHHVPTNAFLSIGLQTSIAITLHKLPEGFITYATNHANPALGFNIFMALFVHNITEGFTMCLPLYMALGSRWKAMAWSALLGGLSQPFGALLAVLWFKLAHRTNIQPNAIAYAGLFAVTSGIMVSVALQLFVESLSLNHNRNLCIFFGFLGMAVLGLSNALFAAH